MRHPRNYVSLMLNHTPVAPPPPPPPPSNSPKTTQNKNRSRPARPSTTPCKLAVFLGEQAIHGERSAHKGKAPPGMVAIPPPVPTVETPPSSSETAKSVLDSQGPEAMSSWVRQKKGVMVTDTTMRDAHQVHKCMYHVPSTNHMYTGGRVKLV